jgi:hypothetical protein
LAIEGVPIGILCVSGCSDYFSSKKNEMGLCIQRGYFLVMRRRLVQAIARNRVATTSTTKVAIGSHSETIEVGVYVGNAIAMLAPCPEYSGGFAV